MSIQVSPEVLDPRAELAKYCDAVIAGESVPEVKLSVVLSPYKAARKLGVTVVEAAELLPDPAFYSPTGVPYYREHEVSVAAEHAKPSGTHEARETESRPTYRFEDITDRDDIILREHFEDLALWHPGLSIQSFIRAFHIIMDGGAPQNQSLVQYTPAGTEQIRGLMPKYNGTILIGRSDAELPPYSSGPLSEPHAKIAASYGFIAGSLLDAMETSRHTHDAHTKQERALEFFYDSLSKQVNW